MNRVQTKLVATIKQFEIETEREKRNASKTEKSLTYNQVNISDSIDIQDQVTSRKKLPSLDNPYSSKGVLNKKENKSPVGASERNIDDSLMF